MNSYRRIDGSRVSYALQRALILNECVIAESGIEHLGGCLLSPLVAETSARKHRIAPSTFPVRYACTAHTMLRSPTGEVYK